MGRRYLPLAGLQRVFDETSGAFLGIVDSEKQPIYLNSLLAAPRIFNVLDYTSLQECYEAVNDAGGGVVYFPAGIHTISTTATCYSNTLHVGDGPGLSIVRAGADLPNADAMIINASGDTALGVYADSNIGFRDLTFDGDLRNYPAWDVGTDPPTYGGLTAAASRGQMVKLVAVENVRIEDCEFKNHRSNGAVNLQGCWNVVIDGNDWHGNGKVDDVSPALYLSDTFGTQTAGGNVTVVHNHFHDCYRIGINFYCDGGGAIIGNTFENLGEGAMSIGQGSQRVVIANNKIRNIEITDIVAMGIEINQKNAPDGMIVVTGNVIEGTDTCAIASNGQNHLVVQGNIIVDAGRAATYPAVQGPYMYARGYAANDPMPDEKRSAIRFATGDLYKSHNTVVDGNVIASDGATTQFALSFIAIGTPVYLHERIRFTGNVVYGMQQGEVNPDTASHSAAGIYIEAAQVVATDATPDLNCMAGNVVTFTATAASAWNAPEVIPPAGSEITVTITQGGAGGYAITWNAAYVFPTAFSNAGNSVGTKTTVRFVSDGTKLVALGANVWY